MSTTELTEQNTPQVHHLSESGKPLFFAVSLTKLLLLSICTLGLYEVYWFYKNWHFVKRREKTDIAPALRSIFSIFLCYALFRRVSEQSIATGGKAILAGPLAIGWIFTTILYRLPDPYWPVTFLAVLFFLPAQSTINSINARVAPDHDPNNRYSGWNIAAIVIGGLCFLLVVIGIFLPQ